MLCRSWARRDDGSGSDGSGRTLVAAVAAASARGSWRAAAGTLLSWMPSLGQPAAARQGGEARAIPPASCCIQPRQGGGRVTRILSVYESLEVRGDGGEKKAHGGMPCRGQVKAGPTPGHLIFRPSRAGRPYAGAGLHWHGILVLHTRFVDRGTSCKISGDEVGRPGMVDPTGLLSYTVSKTLDKVLDYVGKARKWFDHCEDLQTLLDNVKPLVAQAQASSTASTSRATGPSPPAASGQAVEKWLKDLGTLLHEAETALAEALASVDRNSPNLVKKKHHSDKIRKITERIRNIGQDGAAYAVLAELRDIRSELASLSIQPVSQQQGKAAPGQCQHPLVQKLKELRKRTGRDERFRVKLEVADTHTRRFHVPGEGVGSESGDPEEAGNHRGKVVKGGIEVNNATKLQLTMEADFGKNWFFYILFLDHFEGARPSLYFPHEAGDDCNSLLRNRVFPNREDYDDDPETMKLERSSNAPSDACEQVSLYLLLVDTCLEPESPSNLESITIEDVEKHLQSPDLNAIVKHWIFDIRPSKPGPQA